MSEEENVTQEVTDGLDDLIDYPVADPAEADKPEVDEGQGQNTEQTQEPEPETDDTQVDVTVGESAYQEDGKTADDGGEKKREDKPEPETYKYKGKEYTWDDLSADPKLRQNIFTAANQQTKYQELHGENKEKINTLETQLQEFLSRDLEERNRRAQADAQKKAEAERQQQEANRPRLTPDLLKVHYEDELERMKKDGWLEEDVADLYPVITSSVLAMRDELYDRVSQLENQLSGQLQRDQRTAQASMVQDRFAKINSHFDNLAAEGGIFEPLANTETRAEFLKHIRDTLNPPVDHLINNPDILRDVWVGKNHKALIESVERAKAIEASKIANDKRYAAGEGGGARPATSVSNATIPGEAEGWADL